MPIMQHWYLLQSKPKQEQVGYQKLCNQVYSSFLPTIARQKIQRGVLTINHEPLFNRYLFVRLDPDGVQSWAPLPSTIGVTQLVLFGTYHAKLDDELINSLNAQSGKIEERYQEGFWINIIKGLFSGLEAIFASCDDNEVRHLAFAMGERTHPRAPSEFYLALATAFC